MICPPVSDFTDEPRRGCPDLALGNRSKAGKLGARSAGYCCGLCGSMWFDSLAQLRNNFCGKAFHLLAILRHVTADRIEQNHLGAGVDDFA
jgi:hypothetical protein